jgi:type IV pilus assembly protein PilB
MARKRLGEILVSAGVLDEGRLRAALAEQRRWGGPLGRILVDMGGITEEAMVQALSHQLNFPSVNLDQKNIAKDVLDLVPAELAEQHSVVPFSVQGKFLDVAMADPTNLGIIDELRIRTRLNVRPHLAGPKMIERAVARYYGRGIAGLSFDGRHFGPNEAQNGGPDLAMAPAPRFGEDPAAARRTGQPQQVVDPPSAPSIAAARRAQQFEQVVGNVPGAAPAGSGPAGAPAGAADRDRELAALQARVQHLEALIARDEDVLRKLLGLLIEKGLATREEILERIST